MARWGKWLADLSEKRVVSGQALMLGGQGGVARPVSGLTRRRTRQGRLFAERLEERCLLSADAVFTLPAPGEYALAVEGPLVVARDVTGDPVWTTVHADTETITVIGTSGDDTLVVRESDSGFPRLSGDVGERWGVVAPSFLNSGRTNRDGNQRIGLHFEAHAGDDALRVHLETAHDVSYFVESEDAARGKLGNVNIDGVLTLSFAGLTPQVIPGAGGTYTFDVSTASGNTNVTLSNDPLNLAGPGTNVLAGDGGVETTFFAGFQKVVVLGGPNTNRFSINSLDAQSALTAIELDGRNSSAANYRVGALPESVALTIMSGVGEDILTIDQPTAGTRLGPITFDASLGVADNRLILVGAGDGDVRMLPDTRTGGTGTLQYVGNSLAFRNVRVIEASGYGNVTYEPQNADDVVEVRATPRLSGDIALGVHGSSDDVVATLLVVDNVGSITLDVGQHDGSAGRDEVAISQSSSVPGVGQVRVLTGDADDTVRVNALDASLTLDVDTGPGSDRVTVGNATEQLTDVRGVIVASGGGHDEEQTITDTVEAFSQSVDVTLFVGDTLELLDSGAAEDHFYDLAADTFQRAGLETISYSDFETINFSSTTGRATVNISGTPAASTLNFHAGPADDQISAVTTGDNSLVHVHAGGGQDTVEVAQIGGAAILRASGGDDADTFDVRRIPDSSGVALTGNAGDDTLVMGAVLDQPAGLLVIDGSEGNDAIATRANIDESGSQFELAADRIMRLTEPAWSASLLAVEHVELAAGDGADSISVTPDGQVAFTIHGGGPEGEAGTMPGDALDVSTEGLTGVSVPTGVTSGTITADGVLPIVFDGIELLADATLPDALEPNDTFSAASVIDVSQGVPVTDLTLPTDDVDFFRMTPTNSGALRIGVSATSDVVPSPLITIVLRDASGAALAMSNGESPELAFPVAAEQQYVVEVTADAILPSYSFFSDTLGLVPPPAATLSAETDSGTLGDNVTNAEQPRFDLASDLSAFADWGIAILNGDQILAGDQPGIGVRVLVDGAVAGFAEPGDAQGTSWSFTSRVLDEGTHTLTAAIQVVDPQVPPRGATSALGQSLAFEIDLTPPILGQFSLSAASDSGTRDDDGITNVTAPVFTGIVEPDSQVALMATELSTMTEQMLGETAALGDGGWTVTAAALPHGRYEVRLVARDTAGNESVTDMPYTLWIDGNPPPTPMLQLLPDDGTDTSDGTTTSGRPDVALAVADATADSPDGFDRLVRYRVLLREATDPVGTGDVVIDSYLSQGMFVAPGTYNHTLTQTLNDPLGEPLEPGTYTAALIVEDMAGNASDAATLDFTVVAIEPPELLTVAPDLAAASDSGRDATDNVTAADELVFAGQNIVGATVALYSQSLDAQGDPAGDPVLVGTVVVETGGNGVEEIGDWQIVTARFGDGEYAVYAEVSAGADRMVQTERLRLWIDATVPREASLQLLTDSGTSADDNITRLDQLNIYEIIARDSTQDAVNPFPHDIAYQVYWESAEVGGNGETLIWDSFSLLDGFSTTVAFQHPLGTQLNATDDGSLGAGTHHLRLLVEDRAGNTVDDTRLTVTMDGTAPLVSFGDMESTQDGLEPGSDTGPAGLSDYGGDRLTADALPQLWGHVERDASLQLYLVVGDAGTPEDPTDDELRPIGSSSGGASEDGNDALVEWSLATQVSLNDPMWGLPPDGVRRLVVTATDVAGNSSPADTLEIFLDTRPPVVEGFWAEDISGTLQPIVAGTPATSLQAVVLQFSDTGPLSERSTWGVAGWPVARELAMSTTSYAMVGAESGTHVIESVEIVGDVSDEAETRVMTVRLAFAAPLPDDTFTFSMSDRVTDEAGNVLDGEVTVDTEGKPQFPSGDGAAGGVFALNLTVLGNVTQAGPMIGTWGAGRGVLDSNGNGLLDDAPDDARFVLGFASDDVFTGRFVANRDDTTRGVDVLAAYGDIGQSYHAPNYRWLIDVNGDGAVNVNEGDLSVPDPANINGVPVAGDFDGNSDNGDEVGLFTGRAWWLDTDHDFRVDRQLVTNQRGLPVIADVNGDGWDDLVTYFEQEDRFEVDYATENAADWDGLVDEWAYFGFPGVRERPAAGDFDHDGIDDLVLWYPDGAVSDSGGQAEWFIFQSAGSPLASRLQIADDGTPHLIFRAGQGGSDRYAQFGDRFALPLVGRFGEVATTRPQATASSASSRLPGDVNGDGTMSPLDAIWIVNALEQTGGGRLDTLRGTPPGGASSYKTWDTNGDGYLSPLDALLVINNLATSHGGLTSRSATVAPRAAMSLSAVVATRDQLFASGAREDISSERVNGVRADNTNGDDQERVPVGWHRRFLPSLIRRHGMPGEQSNRKVAADTAAVRDVWFGTLVGPLS